MKVILPYVVPLDPKGRFEPMKIFWPYGCKVTGLHVSPGVASTHGWASPPMATFWTFGVKSVDFFRLSPEQLKVDQKSRDKWSATVGMYSNFDEISEQGEVLASYMEPNTLTPYHLVLLEKGIDKGSNW